MTRTHVLRCQLPREVADALSLQSRHCVSNFVAQKRSLLLFVTHRMNAISASCGKLSKTINRGEL